MRMAALSIGGYVAFVVFAFTYAIFDDQVGINLSLGIVCAAAFAGSELLLTDASRHAGPLRRIIVSAGAMVVIFILAIIVREALGWNPRRYQSESPQVVYVILIVGVYAITMLFVRQVWIRFFGVPPKAP